MNEDEGLSSIFDGGFNGAARSEMYRSWVAPDLFPHERPAQIQNWPEEDLEMFCGVYSETRKTQIKEHMFSFKLSEQFIDKYRSEQPNWGYQDAAGNSVGEITFLRTYSRIKEDGTKEQWFEVCERVINGMYSIQKDYARANRLPWNEDKAHDSAEEAFERMFAFKWTPPGRGLWVMGTPLVMEHKNSAPLQNCAFVSTADMTRDDPAEPFEFMMEALMLGVGVGFDLKGSELGFVIREPKRLGEYVIPDTREGWVESLGLLIEAYLRPDALLPEFDYSAVRPAGSPIRTFGGTASGPGPLRDLHERVKAVFEGRAGEPLTSMDILDVGNLIGTCVVAGNVRRSAELALGSIDDPSFLNAKNSDEFPVRNSYDPESPGWGWMSNNSVSVEVGDDLSPIAEGIARNGEPGVIWLDVAQEYGRLADAPNYKDWRVAGFNPCAEQSLESYEMCTLVETYLGNHDSIEDFERTLKFAYLYAKTVTLLPTHWERTNGIMQRNRRIGTSVSGVADFVDRRGHAVLREYLDQGYLTVEHYDRVYSEWLGIRPSIKTTTVKPSGTVSILAGESPGVHWSPGGRFFERRIRFSNDDPMLKGFRAAGYLVEPASESPGTTSVVAFPIESKAVRAEKDVTIFEKIDLAAQLQHWWSDNSVSVTVSFDPETEGKHIGSVLAMYEGRLKTVSFLPMATGTYPQMPYTEIEAADYLAAGSRLRTMDLSPVYNGEAKEAAGEAFCTTDGCEITTIKNTMEAQ